MSLFGPALPSSVLAFATTLHLALASLRNHRRVTTSPVSSLALVSILLAGLPWLFPSVAGVVAGLAVQGLWFAICERFTPGRQPLPAATASDAAGRAARPATPGPPTPQPAASTHPTARPAVRPKGFVQTSVLAVVDEAPDIRTFRFARPDGFDFTAGQFLTIRVRVDNRDVVRCYSLSSAPSAPSYLDITVKRQGLVSGVLHATLRPAALVSVRQPAGAFVYPSGDDRPLLLLAGGIGITPLLSMLRHAVDHEPARPVTLLYSARREEHFAFRDELTAIARRHPQVNVVFAATEAAASPGVYPGRIDEALVAAARPNVRDAIALICGPQPMIDAMRRLLAGMGLAAEQIRFERFEAAVAAAGAPAAEKAADAAPVSARYVMRCSRSSRDVAVAAGQSLLDAAESGGVAIDSLCRAGVCGTCRTRVVEGAVRCESTALDEGDRDQGYVLACVAQIESDCVVEV